MKFLNIIILILPFLSSNIRAACADNLPGQVFTEQKEEKKHKEAQQKRHNRSMTAFSNYQLILMSISTNDLDVKKIKTSLEAMNVNEQDYEGSTLLHLAALRSRGKIVKLLLAQPNIDVTIKNKKGLTALESVEELRERTTALCWDSSEYDEVIALLKSKHSKSGCIIS